MQRKWLELSAEEKEVINAQAKEWLVNFLENTFKQITSAKMKLEESLAAYQNGEGAEIKSLSLEERQKQIAYLQEMLNEKSISKSELVLDFVIILFSDPELSSSTTIPEFEKIDIDQPMLNRLVIDNLCELCDEKELTTLDLAERELSLLSAEQWQLLNEKAFFKNLSRIDLSNNELATCSVDVIKAICLAFGSARYINLSNNGFNDCAPEIWNAFCNELKRFVSNSSRSPLIEIEGLDPIRQMQLQNALKLPSLKAMCVNYFWHQANNLSPNINMISDDLREGLGFAPRMQQS